MNDSEGRRDEASLVSLRLRYLRFAEHEARGISPLYEEFARTVAGSEVLMRFISSLPAEKRQPNLVFAATRHLYGTPRDGSHLEEIVAEHEEAIRSLVLERSTQTNEPARCATLLPALGLLRPPLALLEVGASAGLCLLPDLYAYDYGRKRLHPKGTEAHRAPVLPCRASGATPLPDEMPEVVWRAGIDLNPVDLSDPEEVAWLEALVWPGQEARAERLRSAIRIARDRPPALVRGDLVDDLVALATTAPRDATLVLFHSAVLPYVSEERRERFTRLAMDLDAVWISNEAPGVLPGVAARRDEELPKNRFLLSIDGEPVAVTGPHGQSIDWLD